MHTEMSLNDILSNIDDPAIRATLEITLELEIERYENEYFVSDDESESI